MATTGPSRPGQVREAGGERITGGDEGDEGPDSLEVEVRARSERARRLRIASGDIAAILDALIRRLGTGLDDDESSTSELEREEATASDEDADAEEDEQETGLPELETIPPSEIAAACRAKVRTLVRRLCKQAEHAKEEGDGQAARRAVVQCDAVLAVLHKLRVEALRGRWPRKGLRLLDARALDDLVDTALPLYAAGRDSLFGRAVEVEGGEVFEELVECAALFGWVAWEAEVDLARARRRNGQVGVSEGLWPTLQRFAFLGP